MSRTHKDNPNYFKNIKRKESDQSPKYRKHKRGEDVDYILYPKARDGSKFYHCVERKMPIFYDELDMSEGLIDQMDAFNDRDNDAS